MLAIPDVFSSTTWILLLEQSNHQQHYFRKLPNSISLNDLCKCYLHPSIPFQVTMEKTGSNLSLPCIGHNDDDCDILSTWMNALLSSSPKPYTTCIPGRWLFRTVSRSLLPASLAVTSRRL